MGSPTFYGTDIALRCHMLLNDLEARASEVAAPKEERGSLRPTFLLSIAHPMIILPYERFMSKWSVHELKLHEGELGKLFCARFKENLGLDWLPKSDDWTWRWASMAKVPDGPNVLPFHGQSHFLDPDLKQQLAYNGATAAKTQTATTLIGVLRHSLAHGSVLYLSADGEVAHDVPVGRFLFCNERRNGPKIDAYEFLEITVDDFSAFLRGWAGWLQSLHDEVTKASEGA